MTPLRLISGGIAPLLVASCLVSSGISTRPALAAPPFAGAGCAAVTLQVHPGINPPSKNARLHPAWDAPRGTFTVSLPLYPGATPLFPWVASPYPEYPGSAYLQTAGTEYRSPDAVSQVSRWFSSQLRDCGWHSSGTWSGNTSAFTGGLTFVSNSNPDRSLEMSFGGAPSGGAYIGYGVEWIIYPPRPAASYLHGPFTQVRMALGRNDLQKGSFVQHVVHTTVRDRAAIRQLVSALNNAGGYHTVAPTCVGGGPSRTGPAWLSLVRPNGSTAHAFDLGVGGCLGLAVNGKRWLIDTGAVWTQIQRLARGRG